VVRSYSVTLKRIGAVELRRKQYDRSEGHYRAALALEEALMRDDPANTRWPFEVTYTLSDLALLRRLGGDDVQAEALWTRALDLRRHALAADPNNVRMLSGVATILSKLSGVDHRARRFRQEIARLAECLALRERVLDIQGERSAPSAERAWAVLYLAQAHADFAASGDPAGRASTRVARALFARIAPDLVAFEPPDPEFQRLYGALAAQLRPR